MKENLLDFCIFPYESVKAALAKIDRNKKGFVVVIEENDLILGALTDGDIRRAFLKGISIDDAVSSVYKKNIVYLKVTDEISDIIEIFKNRKIEFLPIADNENRLVNIITKAQMHTLLLMDISADLSYDFTQLDDSIVEHEIYQRPWGFYKTTVMNDYFQSKIISVKPKGRLSLQSHNRREEYWIVAHGRGIVQLGESFVEVKSGSSLFIPKGCRHRLTNTDEKETLIVTEVQIGDYFGEDDIIRYDDIYGR